MDYTDDIRAGKQKEKYKQPALIPGGQPKAKAPKQIIVKPDDQGEKYKKLMRQKQQNVKSASLRVFQPAYQNNYNFCIKHIPPTVVYNNGNAIFNLLEPMTVGSEPVNNYSSSTMKIAYIYYSLRMYLDGATGGTVINGASVSASFYQMLTETFASIPSNTFLESNQLNTQFTPFSQRSMSKQLNWKPLLDLKADFTRDLDIQYWPEETMYEMKNAKIPRFSTVEFDQGTSSISRGGLFLQVTSDISNTTAADRRVMIEGQVLIKMYGYNR